MRPLFIIVVIILVGVSLYFYKDNRSTVIKVTESTPSPVTKISDVEIIATFKIVTNGTVRIFSDSKYHNLSKDVYITSQNPNTIEVKKESVTWEDFFKTLPMSLDKNCLVTGTKQTFCTNKSKKLFFYINDVETPNALDNVINKNDHLLVEYK